MNAASHLPHVTYRVALGGAMLLCLAATARAQIYVGSVEGRPGGVILSNHRSPETPTLLVTADMPDAGDPAASISGDNVVTLPDRFVAAPTPSPTTAALIRSVAQEFAVGEALIKAVVAVESGFRPNARSPKGAMGLMQLMPATATRFGVRDAYTAADNLRGGTAYLRWLLDVFRGDLTLVLAAYNAGEAAVMRAGWRVPDIAETRAYVPKVLAHLAHYGAQSSTRDGAR